MNPFARVVFISLMLFAPGISRICAQQSLLSAGASASAADGSVSFSVGQLQYVLSNSPAGSVQLGVQQAWTVLPSPIWEYPSELQLTIFPNPTGNRVSILGSSVPETGRVLLYDAKGVLQRNAEFRQKAAGCALEGLPPGSYFLMLYHQKQLIYSASLIKSP